MSRRRRRHPARRARRMLGAAAVGVYASLIGTLGWAQRSGEADATPPPDPTPDASNETAGIERLDLGATAVLWTPTTSGGSRANPSVAPTPPPPPSLAATTTTVRRVTVPPPTTSSAPAATNPPASTVAPAPTTTAAPPTTTTIAPPTSPPPTSIPTSGS